MAASIGLAVDPNSGLVYLGTSDKKIRVYDCSESTFVCTYSVATGGSSVPGGICVPIGDTSFVQPFAVEKVDDVNVYDCIFPRDGQITYTITYDTDATFQMVSGVGVYGGFVGMPTTRS